MNALKNNTGHGNRFSLCSRSDALMLVGGLIVVALLLVPYASNGFWFDDALNSQVYYAIQRLHGGSDELVMFTYHVIKHWLLHEGRPMLAFSYGYAGFYFFHDLFSLRFAQCASVVINIALYGYMLRLLGTPIRFLVVWAIILVGLFQIHGAGLDPVAGFAFHYQALGIQLTIVLILFVKWLTNKNPKYLYAALILWLFFMLCYETNAIFIPIAFVLMFLNGDQYKKFPGFLLAFFACLYLALTFYLKSHADGGAYDGSAFGHPSDMGLAYLKQLTATFPFISYLAITHNSLPFSALAKDALFSALAWGVFISSLTIFVTYASIKCPTRALRTEAFIISLGMFLLPAMFPAISLRYQSQVAWGAGTLPVYYQYFGLAFFAAWTVSFIPAGRVFRIAVPICISAYLALNVTVNLGMVKSIDKAWREPRDAFATQAQSGLFSQVHDGDIIYVKNVAHFINSNLIFQWSGKRVYIPTDDHYWFPEIPNKFVKTFELSRSETTDRSYLLVERQKTKAEYQLIAPHEQLVNRLDNFPATLSLVEIQLELNESKILDAVEVLAPDGLGAWTTHPANNLWGVGIIDNKVGYRIRNEGPRKEKLNLPIDRKLILWIPDNGNFSKCPEIQIELLFDDGKRVSTLASCKRK